MFAEWLPHRVSIFFVPPYDLLTPNLSPPIYPGALSVRLPRGCIDSSLASATLSSNNTLELKNINAANAAYITVKNMHIMEKANDDWSTTLLLPSSFSSSSSLPALKLKSLICVCRRKTHQQHQNIMSWYLYHMDNNTAPSTLHPSTLLLPQIHQII